MKRLLAVLVLVGSSVNAQTITETFGAGANQFSIDFVTIGNPGNAADNTGYGSVGYLYNIGKYELSREIVLKAASENGLGVSLADMTLYGGNGLNRPATGITWYGAAKIVNYLNVVSGSHQAYKFDVNGNFQLWDSSDSGYNATNPFRNYLARFFLPSRNEWYKAAYGNLDGTWNNFATGSDNLPKSVSGGTEEGTAIFNQAIDIGPADVANSGGLSPFGTMGQTGNVSEWTETALNGLNNIDIMSRMILGGSWGDTDTAQGFYVSNQNQIGRMPGDEALGIGFRVAMIPEPSSLSLLLAGGAVALVKRRKS